MYSLSTSQKNSLPFSEQNQAIQLVSSSSLGVRSESSLSVSLSSPSSARRAKVAAEAEAAPAEAEAETAPERARRLAEEGTRVTGVTASKDKFVARIKFEGKQVQLGTFAVRRQAIERRLRAEEDVAAGRHPKPKENTAPNAKKKSAPAERLPNELPNELLPAPVSSLDSTEIRELALLLADKRPTAEGVDGVCWRKGRSPSYSKWATNIMFVGHGDVHLGCFADLADAIERRLLGEKAVAYGKHPAPHKGSMMTIDEQLVDARCDDLTRLR
mmetsp:Transcript_7858/g.24113  ORF Transcript_7858/g.24113 Transcript_7858/m.24113 type:complete len:272 (+) Transcript_7858:868-1683(+)